MLAWKIVFTSDKCSVNFFQILFSLFSSLRIFPRSYYPSLLRWNILKINGACNQTAVDKCSDNHLVSEIRQWKNLIEYLSPSTWSKHLQFPGSNEFEYSVWDRDELLMILSLKYFISLPSGRAIIFEYQPII